MTEGGLPLSRKETKSEARVRHALQAAGLSFETYHLIGPYEVDFLVENKVVVEVDGYFHMSKTAMLRDVNRDVYLSNKGLCIIRIEAGHVRDKHRLKKMIKQIEDALSIRYDNHQSLTQHMNSAAMRKLATSLAQAEEKARQTAEKAETDEEDEQTMTDEELFLHWLDKEKPTQKE